jgi:hypothetical protein
VVGEEFGLLGRAAGHRPVCVPDLAGLRIGNRARAQGEGFSCYVAHGFGLMLGLQAFVNVGVNTGLLPTKGLPLPFMSYGSNALIVAVMARRCCCASTTSCAVGWSSPSPKAACIVSGGCDGAEHSSHGRRHRRARVSGAGGGEVLRARGADVFWIGTRAGMEARLVPEHGFDIEWIGIEGVRGKGVGSCLRRPGSCCRRCARPARSCVGATLGS